MAAVLVIGSINLDLVSTVDRMPAPGETIFSHDFATIPGGKRAQTRPWPPPAWQACSDDWPCRD